MAFEIIQLPSDPEGAKPYVEHYKAFRLLSLQTSPETFASTYEREIAFTDDIWLGRLINPDATTFIATQNNQIMGTLTILGPLPFAADEMSASSNPWESTGASPQPVAHWRFNGMFTLPEARRQGIAKALIQKAQMFASSRAAALGKEFIGSIVTESENTAATALYRKCGFVHIKEESMTVRGGTVSVILMKCIPDI